MKHQTKTAHTSPANIEHRKSFTMLDRIALFITQRVGTMGFFLTVLAWTIFWLSWNLAAPHHLRFDPPPSFVFWLFISNMIQILLMPLLLVGQNLQGRHGELRAEHDHKVLSQIEADMTVLKRRLSALGDVPAAGREEEAASRPPLPSGVKT